MSSRVSPARSSTFAVAGMTPVSMYSGSLPTTENERNRARGSSPSCSAASALMMRAADAPSVSGDELPGVMRQSSSGNRSASASVRNAGFRPASDSAVVAGRTVSSTSASTPGTGTTSVAKAPDSPRLGGEAVRPRGELVELRRGRSPTSRR